MHDISIGKDEVAAAMTLRVVLYSYSWKYLYHTLYKVIQHSHHQARENSIKYQIFS